MVEKVSLLFICQRKLGFDDFLVFLEHERLFARLFSQARVPVRGLAPDGRQMVIIENTRMNAFLFFKHRCI